MQVGKIYFVHLREQDCNGKPVNNSGITFAWKVDEEGRLIVGQPAVCHSSDIFVKSEGRRIALDKFNNEDAILVMQHSEIVLFATAQAIASVDFRESLTPSARLKLFDFLANSIGKDVEGFMSTHWYEGLIRSRFQNIGGHLRNSIVETKEEETLQIIDSVLLHQQLANQVNTVSVQ
jgi:hypothetical protein